MEENEQNIQDAKQSEKSLSNEKIAEVTGNEEDITEDVEEDYERKKDENEEKEFYFEPEGTTETPKPNESFLGTETETLSVSEIELTTLDETKLEGLEHLDNQPKVNEEENKLSEPQKERSKASMGVPVQGSEEQFLEETEKEDLEQDKVHVDGNETLEDQKLQEESNLEEQRVSEELKPFNIEQKPLKEEPTPSEKDSKPLDAEQKLSEGEPNEQLEIEPKEQEDGAVTEVNEDESETTTATGTKVTIVDAPEILHKKSRSNRNLNRRASIAYDLVPRFREEDEPRRPSGDFLFASESDSGMFYSYMDVEEEGEEVEEEIEEEEIIRIDREPYYEKYAALQQEISNEKVKNYILQKKLAIYFKRKKMDHVLKETNQQTDTQLKYGRKLDTLAELYDIDSAQRDSITKELDTLKEERDKQQLKLNKLFTDMQEREKEIGHGLIFTKTGNEIPEKVVERLIKRQRTQMDQVSSMRLRFIQLRDMVAEKQDAIAALDKIGENLFLMDYEQLKVDNRSYTDKIEEKEEELTRLRSKCQDTIQILAHLREKSSALESDIDDLAEDLNIVESHHMQVREQLNSFKQERDNYRHMAEKLRNESGLLTEKQLLIDMDHSMSQVTILATELDQLKKDNKIKAQQIRNIRKNIESSSEAVIKKKTRSRSLISKPINQPQIYKGRPSLYKPTLPKDAFNFLYNFKPKPTFDTQKIKTPLRKLAFSIRNKQQEPK